MVWDEKKYKAAKAICENTLPIPRNDTVSLILPYLADALDEIDRLKIELDDTIEMFDAACVVCGPCTEAAGSGLPVEHLPPICSETQRSVLPEIHEDPNADPDPEPCI